LKDSGIDGRLLLRYIFREWDGRHGLDCSGSREGQMADSFESGNELSGCMK